MSPFKQSIRNWGNFPVTESLVYQGKERPSSGPYIARGMGRCYGDSASQGQIWSSRANRCMLDFDSNTGVLTAEAGLSLDEILQTFVPRGWFLPVTPGTKFVSLGGAFASDIHGKNHHGNGCFSDHVHWIELENAKGEVLRCSRKEHRELFELSAGGMGLTGLILRLALKLQPIETAYIKQRSIRCRNLQETIEKIQANQDWTHSVAWIDCLAPGKAMGRSILLLGEHAKTQELPQKWQNKALSPHSTKQKNFPFFLPGFALNSFSVKAFNFLYYHKHPSGQKEQFVHYDPFFYPLDAIGHWNRIYGKRGFTQYQFVLPPDQVEGLIKIIETIRAHGMGSFLTVLKLFGPQKENYLRFPKEGFTLAMDFPLSPKLEGFLSQLDALVLKHGGRVYLTKDLRMPPEMLFASYPQADLFRQKIKERDPKATFQSLQSQRLDLHL